jgi:rRNA maturation protein Nop10
MGVFNTIHLNTQCPHCGEHVELRIQFKYGGRYDYHYRVGDALRWDVNVVGAPGQQVVALGMAEECPPCGQNPEFDIYISDDRIESVDPLSGRYNYLHEGYVAVGP